ncbi:MlaD family protein [Euzebya pacifica]|uniref:MlaD family protein n=1 Tax=Euzebya pacifica TaxID=1608957 RepID=UPI0030F70774
MGRSTAVRAFLGLLIIVGVGTVGWFGTRAAQGAFAEDYRFTVVMGETGQGLVNGSDVVARGVLIGKVGAIELTEDLQAEVELVLEPEYRIPEDAQFAIVGKTLFGEKQLEVRFDGPRELAAAFIPDEGRVTDVNAVVEVQDVLQDLDGLLGAIDPEDLAVVVNDGLGAFVGQEDSIARAIDQGARATNVLSRSLDDQVPTLRDLSLVAEALGPVGDEFNRIASTIDGGALDTLTANQDRLRFLLAELNAFSDQLDIVLELTRGDLDRLMVEGDNVTRVLFAYRPELADMVEGLNDYTDIIGNGGQTDPGWSGFAAGFQIILQEPVSAELCAGVPPELAAVLPICSGTAPPADGGDGSAPPSLPVLDIPDVVVAAPQAPVGDGAITDVFTQVLGDLDLLLGGGQ